MEKGVDELIADFQQDRVKVRSQFLEDYYEQLKQGKRSEYDPRDPLGPRLSSHWQQGDTVFSVTAKRFSSFLYALFNPDTYSKKQIDALKQTAKLNDAYIVLGAAMFSIPFVVLIPFILPRMQRVKREFFMHQFVKKAQHIILLKQIQLWMNYFDTKEIGRIKYVYQYFVFCGLDVAFDRFFEKELGVDRKNVKKLRLRDMKEVLRKRNEMDS